MNALYLILAVLFMSIMSCETDLISPRDCDKSIIISPTEFSNAPDHNLDINSLKIIGDCLKINYSSSGCAGNSWELKLIDSGNVLESYPAQRTIRLSLKNTELCDAYLTKDISFDLSPIQTSGDKVMLTIQNSGYQFLYEY